MAPEWVTAWSTLGMAILTLFLAMIAIFQDDIRARRKHPVLKVSITVSPPDCCKTEYRFSTQEPIASGSAASTAEFTSGSAASAGQITLGSSGQITTGAPAQPFGMFPKTVNTAQAYYFRLKIENEGNQKAESVEVFAATLSKRQLNGTYETFQSFMPMNLVWAHIRTMFLPAISPHTFKHCDLAHIIEPQMRQLIPFEHNQWPADISSDKTDKTILTFDTIVKPYTNNHMVPTGIYRLDIIVAAANAEPIKKTLEINHTGNWYPNEQLMLKDGIGIKII